MRFPHVAFLLLPILAIPVQAHAADVPARSGIESVTVFPQAAEITRLAKVKIEAGSHVVVLSDLPAGLYPDSVRVQGEATAKLEIGSVDARRFFPPQDNALGDSARKQLETELEAQQVQHTNLEEAAQAADVQKSLMVNLAGLPAHVSVPSGAGSLPNSAEWGQMFSMIGEKIIEANSRIQGIRLEMRKVDKKIEELQRQLSTTPLAPQEMTELRINVASDAPLEATLRIRYQISGASWFPLYDVRLETGNKDEAPKLAIARRARVQQTTGEDWTNVALTLSTTQPEQGTNAPGLEPLVVNYEPDRPVPTALLKRKKEADGQQPEEEQGFAAGGLAESTDAAAPALAAPKPVSVAQAQAVVVEQGFQAIYQINGQQSVKSGDGDKKVLIDHMDFEPLLTIRTVPKIQALGYLYAKFKLAEGVRLLGGQASLFRDGVFVGNSDMDSISGDVEHEIGFGVDDLVKVKFATLERKTGESGIISTSTTDDRQFKINVKNLHERPISVRVIDQIPVSENEEIKVDLSPNTTKPTVIGLDDRRGVLAWDLKLEPAEEQEIALGFQVSWPKNKRVMYGQGDRMMLQ